MVKAYRTTVPRPDHEREKAAAVNSEVKSWKMSPEELEDYRARNGYKAPANASEQPAQNKSAGSHPWKTYKADGSDTDSWESSNGKEERSANTARSTKGPDKQAFLAGIAEGKSISGLEKEWKMSRNGLFYWVKKWGLTGITPGKARELLGLERPSEVTVAVNGGLPLAQEPVPEKVIKELRERIIDYENELARWVQSQADLTASLEEVIAERDKREVELLDAQGTIKEITTERDEARQAVNELQEERQLLLATIEMAATPVKKDPNSTYQALIEFGVISANDNVNHPAHYTAGDIECIDALNAALIGLSGGQAYATGSAIECLWRWSKKNGVEDLRKASWYVNRLIGEVEQHVSAQ